MKDLKEAAVDKVKARRKKRLRKRLRRIFRGIFLFLAGVFVGIHWRVIRAYIKGEELPAAPAGHCHTFCRK